MFSAWFYAVVMVIFASLLYASHNLSCSKIKDIPGNKRSKFIEKSYNAMWDWLKCVMLVYEIKWEDKEFLSYVTSGSKKNLGLAWLICFQLDIQSCSLCWHGNAQHFPITQAVAESWWKMSRGRINLPMDKQTVRTYCSVYIWSHCLKTVWALSYLSKF